MAKHRVEDIRNIALVGHRVPGKTIAGRRPAVQSRRRRSPGSVDDGTSVSDYDDEEKKRHFSIDTSLLHLDYKGKHIHLLDAPG